MYPSVRSTFRPFNVKFEGLLLHMYLDVKCLVTTGMGQLIDSPNAATAFPWAHIDDGRPATLGEVVSEWQHIKSLKQYAKEGGRYFAKFASLQTTLAGIDAAIDRTLDAWEPILRSFFPNYDTIPADAQLGILSMAWAMGPGFPAHWPAFTEAVNAGNWLKAADECQMDETGNPGLKPRNAANYNLFMVVTNSNRQQPDKLFPFDWLTEAVVADMDVTNGGRDNPVPPPITIDDTEDYPEDP